MLHELDKTLENILREDGKISKKDIDIQFDQPTGEWSSKLNRPTLNCFCFDMRENLKLRQSGRHVQFDRGKNTSQSSYVQWEPRMDMTYLITAWARKVEDEHQLIWRALQTFKALRILDPERCEGALRYQRREIPIWVADMSEPKANMVDLWGVLENQMKLGFTMTVTLELETDTAFEAPLVLEGMLRIGQSDDPTQREMTTTDVEIKHSPNGDEQEGGSDG